MNLHKTLTRVSVHRDSKLSSRKMRKRFTKKIARPKAHKKIMDFMSVKLVTD